MTRLKSIFAACLLCLAIGNANAETININTADPSAIAATIVGIGPACAEAIVAYREANGPFASVDDLVLVRGIGGATLEKNRSKLTTKKA